MMHEMQSLLFRVAVVSVLSASSAAAQGPAPSSEAQSIGRGWSALATGRADEAVSLANAILKNRPRSHAAFTLKVEALSSGRQPMAALDEYEAWIPKAGHNVDDRGLLQPIAMSLLRVLSNDQDPIVRNAALETLAKLGDTAALDALQKRSAAGDPQAALALVARGDTEAIAALQTYVDSSTGRDVSAAIRALAEHQGLTPTLLQKLAKDRVPMNRAAIAEALVQSHDPDAVKMLESLSHEPDPFIRTSVILARAKNGDEGALTQARTMLASPVADLRLTAAEALVTALPRESEEAARPVLADRNGIYRFRAAAVVGRFDPAAVQSVLIEGLADDNPLIQQEAARITAQTLPDDVVRLRQLLRHADRFIVVQAAGALAAD